MVDNIGDGVYNKTMNAPYNKITVGHCSLYDHDINIHRARLLTDKFKELKFNY